MDINSLLNKNPTLCKCGKQHGMPIEKVIIGKGVLSEIAEVAKSFGASKAFVLSDINTYAVAGEKVCSLLESGDIAYLSYVIDEASPEPDEVSVGKAFMHYDASCDIIIGVGSGVINDICKIVSTVSGKPYIIVGTAPSMDGYASNSSSMIMSGVKVSLPSRNADVIIGDTDVLKTAPDRTLKAGLGDMIAKYISICEWRISNLINGEYYCEYVADLVRSALKSCTDNAHKLLERDDEAIAAVFEGLVVSGIAMNYAGISRPASGIEHYMSHVWDMRGVEFGYHTDLHGTQCAVASLISAKLYNIIKGITPDKEQALAYVSGFSYEDWSRKLSSFVGRGAETMIALEEKEGKYNKEKHKARLEIILDNWNAILQIIEEDLPSLEVLDDVFRKADLPTTLEGIGIDESILPMTFLATKDIRNKYILSHLAWDIGVIDTLAESLNNMK